MATNATHQSLRRAASILRAFTEAEPTLTVSEISRRLDLHKSTVSRILATLADEGLVWQHPADGRYSLGLGLVELAGVALGRIDVRAAAMPHMDRLAEEVGETVTVSVLRGKDAVTVAHVASLRSVRHVAWIGRRLPLHTTATGRVFLAALMAGDRDWTELGLPIPDDSVLAVELEEINRRGVAVEIDEFELGNSCIAAPIRDATGAVVAAITIGAPTERFGPRQQSRAVRLLSTAARDIAWELGARNEESA
jgi:IclR family transcriptional regulator, KDG regulon repressor